MEANLVSEFMGKLSIYAIPSIASTHSKLENRVKTGHKMIKLVFTSYLFNSTTTSVPLYLFIKILAPSAFHENSKGQYTHAKENARFYSGHLLMY